VVRRDQVGIRADHQLRRVDTALVQRGHLLQHDGGVDDDAVADHGHDGRRQDAAGQQVEGELLVTDDDGVAGVVATLVAHDVVDPATQEIGGLSLTFVAPLGTYENDCWHGGQAYLSGRSP
jgi:hypothetical protein